ncbi:fused PTS fructose transporter subunit IIA/HPr protein [Candidatus Williamhamiltonella defendens]|uniref:Bifunctional PTS fructose transporter subunit IIA/HPr protein n=1 Tax=Candidatus Williamhamiltonella defendens TaxID=138072 RepID=A0A2D3TCC2_9ENTR|nr:fused PTS fructose transporter subunit IIA/HPr protein [Candidatus Hamiltonella defensa]ATW33425.1 bifunctional PTS fructose transporter subunit IIA/HPr protein [Candidatus Hamiltonella defensa]
MFQLSIENIHLDCHASNKIEAIKQVAKALAQAGEVDESYVKDMIQREEQISTYLGNGIAIPHGTTESRALIKKTGIQVFQFPKGIEWDVDHIAYIVIGIAAHSDEHLSLLRQLTYVLNDNAVAKKLAQTKSATELRSLLIGETKNPDLFFDISLIALDVPAENMTTLKALNAGRLKEISSVDEHFVSEVILQSPVHLGEGIWLSDTPKGNLLSAIAISRPLTPFKHDDQEVSLLLTVSAADDKPKRILAYLGQLLLTKKAGLLLKADASTLLSLLTSDYIDSTQTVSAEFVIQNKHGLHTRPATLLVNLIKQFNSEINVANLNGTGKKVNACSLMKVVGLGCKQGHRLQFTAQGEDASTALKEIGKAITSGLGETLA